MVLKLTVISWCRHHRSVPEAVETLLVHTQTFKCPCAASLHLGCGTCVPSAGTAGQSQTAVCSCFSSWLKLCHALPWPWHSPAVPESSTLAHSQGFHRSQPCTSNKWAQGASPAWSPALPAQPGAGISSQQSTSSSANTSSALVWMGDSWGFSHSKCASAEWRGRAKDRKEILFHISRATTGSRSPAGVRQQRGQGKAPELLGVTCVLLLHFFLM